MYTTVDTGTLKVTTERVSLRELTFLCFFYKEIKNDKDTLSNTISITDILCLFPVKNKKQNKL